MREKIKQIRAASSPRQLLLVNFATLTMLAVAFVVIILYFRAVHQHVFTEVGRVTEEITDNSEIRRNLVQIELDIRDLLSRILHQSGSFKEEQQQLVNDFGRLILRITDKSDNHDELKLQELLGSYRASLVEILRDYNDINQRVSALDGYYERFSLRLNAMGNKAGELMVDATLEGRNTSGLQQLYILVPFCQEHLLHVQIIIESSVSSNIPALLGVAHGAGSESNTALSNLAILERTLRTLTSGDELVSDDARVLLAELPGYKQEIDGLYHALMLMVADQQRFESLRRAVMVEQERIFLQTSTDVSNVKKVVIAHDNQAIISVAFISAVVLLMSFLGFLLTRKIGLHLEHVAEEALQAKQKIETSNVMLEKEIEERRQAELQLKEARDDLDEKVKLRTADLSTANMMLKKEVDFRFAAEAALADEKERLAVTLRSIGDGVITVETKGKVLFVNKVAEEMTGWSQEEAVGRSLSEVFPVVDSHSREPITDLVDNIVKSGNIVQLAKDMVLVDRDGVERIIADSGAPIRDKDSRIIGVVLVFRDVTGKEKVDAELMKIRKLESVGVLAGGIAHDFNNILAAILGNINLALMSTDPEDKRYDLLAKAEKASLRAKDLTQQLLTFSKGGEPVKKVTSIHEIIEDSASFILRGSNVKCDYDFAEGLWSVEIDPGQVSQVVQNIILNASQAMPDGGLIEISGENYANAERHIPVDADDLVRITIRDHGSGIPKELLERVFDPYFTTKKEGNGLGLAITHSIVAKHGGHIMVDSIPGEGTTFTIYLVGRSGEISREAGVGQAVAPGEQAGGKVLIMDDEDMVRDIVTEMLGYLGYEVLTAKDGSEAIDIYRQNLEDGRPVDVVLLDLTIPGGMGGKETIKKLQEIDPQVKAVVSSGYSNDPVVADYRSYGFSGVVNKPFRLNELAGMISGLIKG